MSRLRPAPAQHRIEGRGQSRRDPSIRRGDTVSPVTNADPPRAKVEADRAASLDRWPAWIDWLVVAGSMVVLAALALYRHQGGRVLVRRGDQPYGRPVIAGAVHRGQHRERGQRLALSPAAPGLATPRRERSADPIAVGALHGGDDPAPLPDRAAATSAGRPRWSRVSCSRSTRSSSSTRRRPGRMHWRCSSRPPPSSTWSFATRPAAVDGGPRTPCWAPRRCTPISSAASSCSDSGITWLLGIRPTNEGERGRPGADARGGAAARGLYVAQSGLAQVDWIQPFSSAGVAAVLGRVATGLPVLAAFLYGGAIAASSRGVGHSGEARGTDRRLVARAVRRWI